MWKFLSVSLMVLSLSSCSSTNISDLVGQLSKDTATSCLDLQITAPWGTTKATYARSNSAANSAGSDSSGGCAFDHNKGAPLAPPATLSAPASPQAALNPAHQVLSPAVWKPDLVKMMEPH